MCTKRAKNRAKLSSNKRLKTFKSAQKVHREVLLLIKVPQKHFKGTFVSSEPKI